MGNVHMEATQINYRGGSVKKSVEEAIKDAIELTPEQKTNINKIPTIEAAVATKAAQSIIAPEFDSEAGVYAIGDLVMYGGKLYEFTTAHETAGEWDSTEVTEKTVADEVDSLKSGLSNLSDYAIRYKRMPGNDGRHYSATISRMVVSRFGMLILVFTETGYVETIGVSVNNQNSGNNIYFSSERASYDRNTKTITIDSGANANAYPMIYYPASFISFS